MLPEVFSWHDDGTTLLFERKRAIAHFVLLEAVDRVRVTVGHWGARPGRQVFLRTRGAATRYIEAWAVKWEVEIREGIRRAVVAQSSDYRVRPGEGFKAPPDLRKRRRPRGVRLS